MNAQGLDLLLDDALRHNPAQILHQKPHTAVLREREGVETHTLPPRRDRSALTATLKPLAVDGTTISFSAFNWAIRPPGQEARNQARKARVSRTPDNRNWPLIRTLSCWKAGVSHLGAFSGAICRITCSFSGR